MDFSYKVKNAEPHLVTKPGIAAETAEQARQLCYAIKNGLKRTRDGLRLYPAEWEGVSSEAHRQFCTEIVGESNENNDALDILIEKLNAVIRIYGKNETSNGSDAGLPISIL